MVAPGSFSRMARATSAVTSDPLTPSACSSTRNTRSASPSKASPTSAWFSITARFRSTWFSGLIGSAGWLGNVPSRSWYSATSFTGSRSITAGTTSPPIPFAVSVATVRGTIESASTKVMTCSTNRSSMSRSATRPGLTAVGPPPSRSASDRISPRPVSSPTGAAPARQNFSPLYWGGLWLAVTLTPGTSRSPEAKYSRSVDTSPRSHTSTPRDVTPSISAPARAGDDRRQSRPTAMASAPAHSANASPIRRAASSSSWSGTTPRTS